MATDAESTSAGLSRACASVVRLDALSPHLLRAFAVRRFRAPRVVWLNHRWFLEAGVDTLDAGVAQDVRARLLADYAVSAPAEGDASDTFAGEARTLYADRYGGTGGAQHGGSGRSGVWGAFNAKGVGRTPLATDRADWAHAHGCLWLDEAIREAICAEIADAELPYGAIPIIAVIDTGVDAAHAEAGRMRRAIVVRPNFVRPAHCERSIFFGTSGGAQSDQYLDALRVKDVVQSLAGPDGRSAAARFDGLSDMFLRFAAQVGVARAHRLWQGRLLTSNLSIDGALVDFGSFRAVPSWRRFYGQPGEAFGGEARAFEAAIRSLCFYFKKYARQAPEPKALSEAVEQATERAFLDACIANLRLPAGSAAAAEGAGIIREYYRRQQREVVQVGWRPVWRRPWLHDCYAPYRRMPPSDDPARALAQLVARFGSPLAAARWLRPRPLLYYEVAGPRAGRLCRRLTGDDSADADLVAHFIAAYVSRCRRVWPHVPAHIEVVAQATDLCSTALTGVNPRTGGVSLWLDCVAADEAAYVFGRKVPVRHLPSARPAANGRRVTFELRKDSPDDDWSEPVGALRLRIPSPDVRYRLLRA